MPEEADSAALVPQRPDRRLALFLAAVSLLYAVGMSTQWRFHRDSLLYMGLARSLVEQGTYSFNHQIHSYVWPGQPLLLVPVYAVFGESFFVMNALMSLLGVGCVIIAHMLFRKLPMTARQVWVCTLLFGLSRSLYYYSSIIITEVPYTSLVLACLYCSECIQGAGRRGLLWAAAAGTAAAAACCFRPVGWALYPALIAGLWSGRRRIAGVRRASVRSLLVLLPPVALGGLWFARSVRLGSARYGYFGDYVWRPGVLHSFRTILRHLDDAIEPLSDTVLGYDLGMAGSLLLLVPVVVGLGSLVRRGERQVSVYGIVSFVGICLANPSRRYLMPILPSVLPWLVLGMSAVGGAIRRRQALAGPLVKRVGVVLLVLALATNLMRISKLVYEARTPRRSEEYAGGRMAHYYDLVDWLSEHADPDDCVMAGEHRFLHYFSRLRTSAFPRPWELRRAGGWQKPLSRRRKATLMVLEPGEWPPPRALRRLRQRSPDAVATIRHFGPLELARFRADRLR
jgi:hypothetical protein